MGRTLTLEQARALPFGQERAWAYGALDVTGTREVFDTLYPRLSPAQRRIYALERGLQAPFLSMGLRGTRVDQYARGERVKELKKLITKEEKALQKVPSLTEVWDVMEKETGACPVAKPRSDGSPGKHKWPKGVPDAERHCERCGANRLKLMPFNPGSSDQKAHLFYDLHHIPPMLNKLKKVSTDDDILERIGRGHPHLRQLVEAIRGLQDFNKQLGTLSARLTSDGRYTSSFNVGAAWTGRASSSKDPFGRGGNKQNIGEQHRNTFIADPGMEIGYADYKQGESNIVAHLSGDEKYIAAHLSGDVHTFAARLIWPDMPWTGDLAKDKKVAKALPNWDQVAGHDFRFQAKRFQHGANYGLTPQGISMIEHIPLGQARGAYRNYMYEFDGIGAWQQWMRKKVEGQETICNPLGRCINLFGRPWDKHTWRQGLAFQPQSTLADIEDIAIWRVWRYLEEKLILLLAQVHDAILHELPEKRLDLERELLKYMSIPVPVTDIRGKTRIMTIGVESALGKNWGHYHAEKNPRGIREDVVDAYLKEHPL